MQVFGVVTLISYREPKTNQNCLKIVEEAHRCIAMETPYFRHFEWPYPDTSKDFDSLSICSPMLPNYLWL